VKVVQVEMMAKFVLGQALHLEWLFCIVHQKVYSYVCGHGLGTSLADCSGRRVHTIDLIWWYACYYIRDDFMYVGMAWVRPCLIALAGEYIRLTLTWWYAFYYIREYYIYVGVAWADRFGRRVHMVTYYEGW